MPDSNVWNIKKIDGASRKRIPSAGSIFTYYLVQKGFCFGRVIKTSKELNLVLPSALVYLYRAHSSDPHDIPSLKKDALLVPPFFADSELWWHGYFLTVRKEKRSESDCLERHCFSVSSLSLGGQTRYQDEYGNWLPEKTCECGGDGVWPVGVIDLLVSRAWSLPKSPGAIAADEYREKLERDRSDKA